MKNEHPFTWFIEFDTYRWREHCGYQFDNDIGYRSEEEFQSWKLKDPIELFKKEVSGKVNFEEIERFVLQEIDEAFEKAKSDPFPLSDQAFNPIYAK